VVGRSVLKNRQKSQDFARVGNLVFHAYLHFCKTGDLLTTAPSGEVFQPNFNPAMKYPG
jgi:hypothetical protein